MILPAVGRPTFLRENIMVCDRCGSDHIVKNGHRPVTGKQKYRCQICGYQFVENPEDHRVSDEKKGDIRRLLLERLSLAGIARAMQVSESWLQDFVNTLYETVPRRVAITKKKGPLTLECDELWSFVDNRNNKQWVWLAIDRDTREIVGAHIGDRSEAGEALWDNLPPVYRQCAMIYTDYWSAYGKVFPSKRHRAVGKETGLTNHIERFNCTLRQRCSRLVRKALSFSKKL